MCELGDEELMGVVPKEMDSPNNKLRPFGIGLTKEELDIKELFQRNNR